MDDHRSTKIVAGADSATASPLEIGLNAAIISMRDAQPQILCVPAHDGERTMWDSLPYGPFTPLAHRTLEIGLRDWVLEQTGLGIGYVEQLYTFGDRGRHARPGDRGPHVVSIGYLALIRMQDAAAASCSHWSGIYAFLPWEDWREGKPAILTEQIEPLLRTWAKRAGTQRAPRRPLKRSERLRISFGLDGASWDDEKVLDRYELLYEAGLVVESARDGREAAGLWDALPLLGRPMHFDHRRILATAIGRLRSKIKYRPVVFELMGDVFTLYELQQTVEGILGSHLHKQNFRRLVEGAGLVEPTGDVRARTGGRPAKLYRFRHEVLLERPSPGVRVRPGIG